MITVALIGSETLMGREIRDIVATSSPGFDLRLVASDDERAGTLTRLGDEPAVVEGLVPVSLAGARAIFLVGSSEANRKAIELADPGTAIIDLTGAIEERPDARLRAPLLESEIDEEAEG